MAVTTNLYPPIVNTYMPAFLINSESVSANICRVYFSLSMFNTTSQIKNVQVVVRNQNTNASALNPTIYPSEIKLTEIKLDETITTDAKYYIEILPTDMKNQNFEIDQYYKVQLRFTDISATDPIYTDIQAIDDWLIENLFHFSEWSTVTLIRGISVPNVKLQDFTSGSVTDIYSTIGNINIIGKLTFADSDENETLKYYQITLYDNDDNILVKSDNVYTSDYTDPNTFNYTIGYNFNADETYYFKLKFTTQNLYEETITCYIYVLEGSEEQIYTTITATKDDDNGRVEIKLERDSEYGPYTGQLIIRRSESTDNFKLWSDMYIQTFKEAESINLTWYDYTVESGVFYKYAVQGVDENNGRTSMTEIEKPLMLLFDDIFLTIADQQLKIRFDPQINSFKRNISESKIDTIGSKYPFIKRNGYVDYIQMPLSGLISSAMDEDGLFITKEEIYGDNKNAYAEYNEENEIPVYRDFIYEKFFRDKVMNFLYANEAKLFRSPTEGNILVKLMDIQLTPNQVLGRRLWSFNCNLYEIDECSLENYKTYGICKVDEKNIIENSPLTPIRRIVFIDDISEFPDEGKEHVIYIFERQLYIWSTDEHKYIIISIPLWNTSTPDIDIDQVIASRNELFTDGTALFVWNPATETFDSISEPEYEQGNGE